MPLHPPGEARVNTETPAGPLYRVVGSLLSISCNTSGFSNNHTKKEFEFRVKMPQDSFEINVISTHDQFFSYAMYLQRVKSKEVRLTHVTPNSAVFEIQSLRKSDEGEYECYVKNPEAVYDGTYNAKTTVRGNPFFLSLIKRTGRAGGDKRVTLCPVRSCSDRRLAEGVLARSHLAERP